MNQADTLIGSSIVAVGPTDAAAAPAEAPDGLRPPPANTTAHPDHRAALPATDPPAAASPPAPGATSHLWRRVLLWAGAVAGLCSEVTSLAPTVETMLNTVSTDDAYVNGHVTSWPPGSPAR